MPTDTTAKSSFQRRISSEFARKARLYHSSGFSPSPRLLAMALLPLTRPPLDPKDLVVQLFDDTADLRRIYNHIEGDYSVPVRIDGQAFKAVAHERFQRTVEAVDKIHEIQWLYQSRGITNINRPIHAMISDDIECTIVPTKRGQTVSSALFSVSPKIAFLAHPARFSQSAYNDASIVFDLAALARFKSLESCIIYLRALTFIANAGKPHGEVNFERVVSGIHLNGKPDAITDCLGIGWKLNQKSFRQRIDLIKSDLKTVGVNFEINFVYKGAQAKNNILAYDVFISLRQHNYYAQSQRMKKVSIALDKAS